MKPKEVSEELERDVLFIRDSARRLERLVSAIEEAAAHLADRVKDIEQSPAPVCTALTGEPLLTLKESEEKAIRSALIASGNSRTTAAKILGIGHTTMYRRASALGIPLLKPVIAKSVEVVEG